MKKISQHGFTLVEALVVIVLIGSVSYVLLRMFISQNRIYTSENAQINVTSTVRLALDDIDNYVRQANLTLASRSSGTDNFTAGPQVLILQIQSVNSSGRLIGGTYDYVIYYMTGQTLTRLIEADSSSARASGTKILGTNFTNLQFTYSNADYSQVDTVKTTLTASETSGQVTRTFTNDSEAKLRNFQ